MEINSLQNAQVKKWVKLKQKKYREAYGLFIVEGMHLIEEAHKAGLIDQILCLKDDPHPFQDYPCIFVTKAILDKVTDSVSGSSIAAICHFPSSKTISTKRWILLDHIQDPGNVGTIIRTAYSLGYDAVFLSQGCADPYSEKVIRSTQGALFHLHLETLSLPSLVQKLKQQAIPVYATALHHESIPLSKVVFPERCAVIFGNEGQGVSSDLLALSDATIFIEMERFESLNVAVAAGITLYKMKSSH